MAGFVGAERDSVNDVENEYDVEPETEELLENERESEPEAEAVSSFDWVHFDGVVEMDGDIVMELDDVSDQDCEMVPLLLEVLSEGDLDAILIVPVPVVEFDTDALLEMPPLAVFEEVYDSEATAEALSVESTQHPLALAMHCDLLMPLSVALTTDWMEAGK